MTTTDVRTRWLNEYQRLSAESAVSRDSQSFSFGLLAAYDELAKSEKDCIHRILAEWFVSEDNKLRYDAGFLTSERRIIAMKAAVEKAVEQAERRSGPEAGHEAKKLRRILAELS